eukprot:gene25219-32909_t
MLIKAGRTTIRTSSFRPFPLHLTFSTSNDRQRKKYSTSWNFSSALSSIISAFSASAAAIAYNVQLPAIAQESSVDGVDNDTGVSIEKGHRLLNWSSTHSCDPEVIYYPKSAQEISRVLSKSSFQRSKLRPVGTALSPNGIGLSTKVLISQEPIKHSDLISLNGLDYVEVDVDRNLVTVGAGTTVRKVLEELRRHGLTLQNFSSIQEQQIGGWTQVAAHGTGCTLPTVDEMIQKMTIISPVCGPLTLSRLESHATINKRLFDMARVGLGSLGVVSELTLSCIPSMRLKEETHSETLSSIASSHYQRLKNYRHVRYMWIPYTPSVVVVTSNPCEPSEESKIATEKELSETTSSAILPTQPLIDLLLEIQPQQSGNNNADLNTKKWDQQTAAQLSFSQLRDILLDIAPLDVAHIRRVNAAEAAFWAHSSGVRVADSTEILGFDCGGEQLVYEVCFPIGRLSEESNYDLTFVRELLQLVEQCGIPAASPIEQRWTARSTSPMSPAYSTDPDEVFSWVGIIMYLPPSQTEQQRQEIQRRFDEYTQLIEPLVKKYKANVHWAKIELPPSDSPRYEERLHEMQERIRASFPVGEYNQWRRVMDPNSILSNDLIDRLFADEF